MRCAIALATFSPSAEPGPPSGLPPWRSPAGAGRRPAESLKQDTHTPPAIAALRFATARTFRAPDGSIRSWLGALTERREAASTKAVTTASAAALLVFRESSHAPGVIASGVIRRRASAHPRDCFSPGGVVDRLAPWRPVRASGRQALHGSRDRICVFDGAELACASATIQHSDGAGAGVCSAQKESGARALFGRVLRRRGDGGGLSVAPRCGQSHSAQEPPPGAQAETSHWPSTRCGIDARLETCLRC